MNIQLRCPNESELSDLLEGNLVDPELSRWAEHLESCVGCQKAASRLSSKCTLVDNLRSKSTELNNINERTPRTLRDRIKQIPIFASEPSRLSQSVSNSSNSSTETIEFTSDPTPGVLGKLGQYRILRMIGAGGMGSVFLAEDIKLDRYVALKVMLPKIAVDPMAKQRFLREARSAASLKSDHVVTVHQVGEEDSMPYMAMELLVGCSLEERIRTGEPISVELIIHVALGVAKGLADAHEKGMVHRDIKPGNIWLEQTEERLPRIKILDFGLARMEMDDTHLTQVKAIVGTPAFMAPEQARGNCAIDGRSDLFSLGCVLYYLCTGDVPFKADNTLATLMALAVNTPPAPLTLNDSIPVKLSQLTMDLLQKDPAERPNSARAVFQYLGELKNEIETGAAQYSEPTNKFPRNSDPRIDRKKATFFTFASFVVITTFAAWFVSSKWFALPSGTQGRIEGNEKSQMVGPDLSNLSDGHLNQKFKQFENGFKNQNPEFLGTIKPKFKNGEIAELVIAGRNVFSLTSLQELSRLTSLVIEGIDGSFEYRILDLAPLSALKLTKLNLRDGYATDDLNSLRGMSLIELSVDSSPISDLKPLSEMPLQFLYLWNWCGDDLSPLRGMPLKELNLGGNPRLKEMGALAGLPLEFLCINISSVSDLEPLRGAPLRRLYCNNSLVSDLSPLMDSPLEELLIAGTKVRDISIAKTWPLKWIEYDFDLPGWRQVLMEIPTLERIKDQSANAVIAAFDNQQWRKNKDPIRNVLSMELVLVPKGVSMRGRGNFDEYLPAKQIVIEEDFYIGRYEVTQGQWLKVMGKNPSYFSRSGEGSDQVLELSDEELLNLPVENVSWLDCQTFLNKLNELDPHPDWTYRLPSEAEWTYACQGGPMNEDFDVNKLFFLQSQRSNLPSYLANSSLSGIDRTISIGSYPPNALGIFDMHGNVWEWCNDLASVPGKQARWIHGGSWRDEERKCSSAYILEPTERWVFYDLGFRVARVPVKAHIDN